MGSSQRMSSLRIGVRCFFAIVVTVAVALSLAGAATSGEVVAQPTLVVVILGRGSVASTPAGISCPGKCTATFAAGMRVLLTPVAKNGSRFLRWGGSCTGAGACRVRVSSLAAVAAQFVSGSKTQPQPPRPTSAATPGSYTGQNGQNGNGISFYVSPAGTALLNVYDSAVGLTCTPSGGATDHLGILKTAIRPNGSFTAKASQTGLFAGSAAKFTYTFTGRFQAATAAKAASAAGTWREDVTNAAGERCTSNDQSWTATRDPEPLGQKLAIELGNYTGQNGQNGNGMTFSVAPGGKSILNVTDSAVGLLCPPSGGLTDHLGILKTAIKPDGSFSAKTSQDGVLAGAAATFTYTFSGYFEGATPAGAETVAGTWREDIAFTSGTTKTCTSNDQSWKATRTS